MPGPAAPAAPVTGLAGLLSRKGVYYGFAMVAVTLLVLVMSAGFRSAPSVMIVPLQDQFGWSRATISSAVSINLVCFGLACCHKSVVWGRRVSGTFECRDDRLFEQVARTRNRGSHGAG